MCLARCLCWQEGKLKYLKSRATISSSKTMGSIREVQVFDSYLMPE